MAAMTSNYKVHCSVDEPIQRLMEKLSAKSPELYIFWVPPIKTTQQNYNQLYLQYADRVTEVEMARAECDRFRAEADRLRADCDRLRAIQAEHRCPTPQPIQQPYPPQPVIIEKSTPTPNNDYELASLKEKVWTLQRQSSDLKHQVHWELIKCEHWRQQADELSLSNETLIEENRNFQLLLKQFKTENAVQKENIDHIVARLKEAEIDLQGSRTSRSNQDQLNQQLMRAKQTEQSLRKVLQDKQNELQMFMVSVEQMRASYERMLSDAVRSIKGKMIESLPGLIEQARTTKHLRYTSDVIHR